MSGDIVTSKHCHWSADSNPAQATTHQDPAASGVFA